MNSEVAPRNGARDLLMKRAVFLRATNSIINKPKNLLATKTGPLHTSGSELGFSPRSDFDSGAVAGWSAPPCSAFGMSRSVSRIN